MNTKYLTDLYIITTVDNVPMTEATGLPIAVVTATDSASGLDVGDVSVALSLAVVEVLNNIGTDLAAKCSW